MIVAKENYTHEAVEPREYVDIVKGMRRYGTRGDGAPAVRLLGSRALLREAIAAAELLTNDWGIASEIWSVTSFSELAREALEAEWENSFAHGAQRLSYVARSLPGTTPVAATSDYVHAYAQLIVSYVEAPYTALGTDGFGRGDTRAAVRRFFEVDRRHIALLAALAATDRVKHVEALALYDIETGASSPWNQ